MRTTGATDEQIHAAVFMVARQNYMSDESTWRAIHQGKMHGPNFDLVTINQAATALCNTDHRIVRVDDLRALHNVALNFREHVASGVIVTMLNRAGGDMESDAMDEAGEKARAAWNARYPEFADACARIEDLIGEAE